MATASDKAKDVIDDVADKTDQAITGAASRASSATRRAKGAARDAVDAVDDGRDVLEDALVCAKSMVRANPIASVVVVAALAYLCGRMK